MMRNDRPDDLVSRVDEHDLLSLELEQVGRLLERTLLLLLGAVALELAVRDDERLELPLCARSSENLVLNGVCEWVRDVSVVR